MPKFESSRLNDVAVITKTDRQTHRQTDTQKDRQTDTHTHRKREREIEAERVKDKTLNTEEQTR